MSEPVEVWWEDDPDVTDYAQLAEDTYKSRVLLDVAKAANLYKLLKACDRERQEAERGRRRAKNGATDQRLKRQRAEALVQRFQEALECELRDAKSEYETHKTNYAEGRMDMASELFDALAAGQPQEWGGNVDAENDALAAGDKPWGVAANTPNHGAGPNLGSR